MIVNVLEMLLRCYYDDIDDAGHCFTRRYWSDVPWRQRRFYITGWSSADEATHQLSVVVKNTRRQVDMCHVSDMRR